MDSNPKANIGCDGIEGRERTSAGRTSFITITIAVTIAAAVYVLDLALPLGVAGGVPYVALVIVGWWFPMRWVIFFLAAISSALTVAGYYYSPYVGVDDWMVLTNRAYALFAIWGMAISLWAARRSQALVLLSEAKLKDAMHRAEAANRAKSDLLANMSHELRTPLNAIIGFSYTMQEKMFGPIGNDKYQEYVDDIHYSGEHLLELINDILDVSAFEVGAIELNENNVNISDVVDASMRINKSRAEHGQVTITSSIDPEITLIYADKRRVNQVILNLLSNAIKFTQEGGEVSVSSYMNGDGSFAIAVSDTGIGMDDEEAVMALSMFGQVDSGLDRKHEGTGLGLPLTKGLMELHGGTLEVESEKGHGTSVTVTFPKERVVQNARLGSQADVTTSPQ